MTPALEAENADALEKCTVWAKEYDKLQSENEALTARLARVEGAARSLLRRSWPKVGGLWGHPGYAHRELETALSTEQKDKL